MDADQIRNLLKSKYFQEPKDEPYFCADYPPVIVNRNMEDRMVNTITNPTIEKARMPPIWPIKTPNPCLTKNHQFKIKEDIKDAPKMTEEQVHEVLRHEVYMYNQKIKATKDKYVKYFVESYDPHHPDPHFEFGSTGYWNTHFMPIVTPNVEQEMKKNITKDQLFNVALFYAAHVSLGLEQVLMDETIQLLPKRAKFEEVYFVHLRLVCILRQSMALMKLDESFNFDEVKAGFRYRYPVGRFVTYLRSYITLRCAYNLSYFIYNVLYRYRFNRAKNTPDYV